MINESKLWDMLDQLQYFIGVSDDRQDDLWEAIGEVMADLDTNDAPDMCQDDGNTPTMPMSAYWIPWRGGEQPVPDGTEVAVRLSNNLDDPLGFGELNVAEAFNWKHTGYGGIIAYRVIDKKPEEEVPPIPRGVPCWISERDGTRHLGVATGVLDRYISGGAEYGPTDSAAPGTMRPVCFEDWTELGPHIKTIELVYSRSTWTTRWLTGQEEPTPGNYFERRPQ